MDNDNEINNAENDKELAHREVRLLLKNELKTLEFGSASSYDLNAEYAKTRKHHNTAVWVLLAACFVVVVFASYAVTKYVSNENKQISINIDTFDDLNLRGLLDMVGRTDGLYRTATKKRADLQASLDYGLKQASEKRDNDLFTLQSLALRDKKEIARRKAAIQNEYKAAVKNLHDTYDVQIQSAENEVKQYQQELASYDSTKLAHAQEQEAAIDSQRQLHDLEMQNQSKRFETSISGLRNQLDVQQQESVKAQRAAVSEVTKKYQAEIALLDPVVKDPRGDSIIAAENASSIPLSYNGLSYTGTVQPGETLASALKRVQSIYSDFDYTANIVSSIPWQNTMPSYVRTLRQLSYQIGDTMTTAALAESAQLQKRIAAQQIQINAQNSYLESVLQNNGDGMILDVSDRSMMPVYVNKSAAAKITAATPVSAYVTQDKNTYQFRIENRSGVLYAVPSDTRDVSALRPGDAFTIR